MKWCLRLSLAGILLLAACLATAQTSAAPPIEYVKVPGNPFTAVPSSDGQWVFVSMIASTDAGIAVLHHQGDAWVLRRFLPFKPGASGLALSHDDKLLLATAPGFVIGFDVEKLISGVEHPAVGQVPYKGASAVFVAITPDDKCAFVSNESAATLSVINLTRIRQQRLSAADLIGTIPVGRSPVGLAFSPDGTVLYSTSEVAPAEYGWPNRFPRPGRPSGPLALPEGVVTAIDVQKAETDPSRSVIQKVPAGDQPVRLVISSDGKTAYVTTRGANSVSSFATAGLLSPTEDTLVAKVPVGQAPVGLALSNDGQRLFVLNSNRFESGGQSSTISVIDTTKFGTGAGAVIGTIPTGGFPREARLSPDGRTLIVTNFDSDSVEFIDISGFLPGQR